jgi:hypothetical protein
MCNLAWHFLTSRIIVITTGLCPTLQVNVSIRYFIACSTKATFPKLEEGYEKQRDEKIAKKEGDEHARRAERGMSHLGQRKDAPSCTSYEGDLALTTRLNERRLGLDVGAFTNSDQGRPNSQ